MENDKKISIIVPIYRVEKYLDKCISSICSQSYKNLEIILVDDGSNDQCPQICDEWAGRDERIVVRHVQNGGQSYARNIGLEFATGEYIGFVDGDDTVHCKMYEILLALMEKHGADIVECNFIGRKANAPDVLKDGEVICMNGRDAIELQLNSKITSRYPSTSLWSKLFRGEVIAGMRLPDGCIHEEYAFLCEAFLKCNYYVYINEPLYERTLREDSTTAEKFSVRSFDKLKVFRMRNQYLLENHEKKLYLMSRQQELELMLHYYGKASLAGMKKDSASIRQEIKNCIGEILVSGLPIKKKMQFVFVLLCPTAYNFVWKCKNEK